MEGSLLKYQGFVKELIVNTVIRKKLRKKSSDRDEIEHEVHEDTHRSNSAEIVIGKSDHPLNSQKDSKWKTYFEDYELWNLIEQDTIRTRQSVQFFQEEHLFELNPENESKDK